MLCFGREITSKGTTADAALAAVDLCWQNPDTQVLAVGGNRLALDCELRQAILQRNVWSQIKYYSGTTIPFRFRNGSRIHVTIPDRLLRSQEKVEVVWIDRPVDQSKLNNAYLAHAVHQALAVWVSDRQEGKY